MIANIFTFASLLDLVKFQTWPWMNNGTRKWSDEQEWGGSGGRKKHQ